LHLQADIYHYRPLDFFIKRPAQTWQNKMALRRTIDQARPHVVVVFGMWNLSRKIPDWAERWLGNRVAYYISSTWPSDLDIHFAYWNMPARRGWAEALKDPFRKLALWTLKREHYPPRLAFAHAMCVSRYVRDVLINAGLLTERAGIINNGLDPAVWLQNARQIDELQRCPLRLVYTGSLDQIKGVHTAIEAVRLLKQRGLDGRVDLTIIGGGHPSDEARLRQMVDRFELHQRVHFAGRIERTAIPMTLPQYDVFLFTSCGPEAMARSVMEAMAAGLMVIGAETGGQVEMLEHLQNALTFEAEDALALADCIERAMNDPVLRARLSRAGQKTILDQFTLDRMVDDIEGWLERVASENPAL
jgi:glycosyltransferase involved in cell wall biosynthesis